MERTVRRIRGAALTGPIARAVAARLLGAALTLWAVASALFVLVHLAPGDAVAALGGDFQTAETRDAERARLGLDRGLWASYAAWATSLAQADFGTSIQFRAPVTQVIGERLPVTLALVVPALVVSTALGVAAAVWSALRPGGAADRATGAVLLVVFAVPVYVVAQLLIAVFAIQLGWLPVQGLRDLRAPATGALAQAVESARHLALPIATLASQFVALVWLVTRSGLIAARAQPHFATALAKGLSLRQALVRHALQQAGLSLVTVIGARVGALLTAATLVETVFGLPGVGRLLVGAALARDHPLAMGVVLSAVALTLAANALTDALYHRLDPRIRLAD